MPGSGPHRFEFVGRTPWVASALVILLVVNTLAGLVCLPIYRQFAHSPLSNHAWAAGFRWYEEIGFVGIQFVLPALIGIVLLIYRKDVRYAYRGREGK